MSFAKKLIEQGDYEEAIEAATKDIEEGIGGPEPFFDRGTANELAEKYADAVRDFETCIETNKREKELDRFALDDAYFSALLALARSEKDATRLDRYRDVLPDGAHLADARDWQKRIRGEMPSLLDKTKDLNTT
jgi:hypothetical protein